MWAVAKIIELTGSKGQVVPGVGLASGITKKYKILINYLITPNLPKQGGLGRVTKIGGS